MESIDLSSVDLNLLVAFEALFTEQSVTAAAQRLHIGQPAMSAALARLRVLLGDELFVRVGRQMRPTPRATELAPAIRQALTQIRQLLTTSQPFDPITAQRNFVIGSSDYFTTWLAPHLIQASQGSQRGLTWELTHFHKEEVPALLERGGIDVALGTFTDLPSGIHQQPLIEERLVGICRPGHPALHPNLSDVEYAAMPHALFTLRRDRVGEVDRVLAQRQLRRRIVLTTSYFLVLPSMMAASDLVSAVPLHLARHFQEQGLVELFELPVATEPWMISLIWSRLLDQDPAHQWLRQLIQQSVTRLSD
ncbi:MAG: LysR family transcriptional regulator [Cyanobacteriota bacterium]|nr:LysR family transcriptional regulator [Cyanobacteriota bacterium]